MKFETFEYTLPAHWACALCYGDLSGIDCPDEEHAIEMMLERIGTGTIEISEEPFFLKYHDAPGIGACQCLTYTVYRPVS